MKSPVRGIDHCTPGAADSVRVQYVWNECGNGVEAESRKGSCLGLALPVTRVCGNVLLMGLTPAPHPSLCRDGMVSGQVHMPLPGAAGKEEWEVAGQWVYISVMHRDLPHNMGPAGDKTVLYS